VKTILVLTNLFYRLHKIFLNNNFQINIFIFISCLNIIMS